MRMIDISAGKIGFRYVFECVGTDGGVKWRFEEDNVIPGEGRDYLMNAALLGGSQFTNWFIGLYEGAHAPVVGDTMATFPGTATEITGAYTEASRVSFVPDALSGGVFANAGSPAIFTFNAPKTVRGGFISSAATKGATTGVLLSAVLASSPKIVGAGEALRVTAGLSLISL